MLFPLSGLRLRGDFKIKKIVMSISIHYQSDNKEFSFDSLPQYIQQAKNNNQSFLWFNLYVGNILTFVPSFYLYTGGEINKRLQEMETKVSNVYRLYDLFGNNDQAFVNLVEMLDERVEGTWLEDVECLFYNV